MKHTHLGAMTAGCTQPLRQTQLLQNSSMLLRWLQTHRCLLQYMCLQIS